MKIRRSPQSLAVLGCFAEEVGRWKYGYDISRSTGLKSGTLYPLLIRLAGLGLLETMWETAETGRPPRHLYRLTDDGMQYARQQLIDDLPHRLPSLQEVTVR
jgi:DNA-binding PadR family transcriptional regulator